MPQLCVIPGDGIGREVVPVAVSLLQAVIPDLEIVPAEAGWDCFLQHGVAVPEATLAAVRRCGAALFGAVSSPARPVPGYRSAIITLRQTLGLYANIRPVRSLSPVSPRSDVDLIIVRENSEGLYTGREWQTGDTAVAERIISRAASQRIARRALELAQLTGRRRLTIVHKANVLPLTDGLFRDTVRQVAVEFGRSSQPVEINELLVDTAALKLVEDPTQFDVIVTTNLFGDILSDVAAYWGGGLAYAPSLNWGDGIAVAEPVHGSAPDIAGRGLANPAATILSAALLVRYLWGDNAAATRIETAVANVMAGGQGQQVSDWIGKQLRNI
jgi:homoisocitrate dehydrogenase